MNWRISIAAFGSCFIAGTEVITRSGVKKIEDLAEHDWVLTRGEFDEWGKVTDEKVEVPVDMPILHGFSESKPLSVVPCLRAPGHGQSLLRLLVVVVLLLLVGRRHGTLRCKSPTVPTPSRPTSFCASRAASRNRPRQLAPVRRLSLRFQEPWGRKRARR